MRLNLLIFILINSLLSLETQFIKYEEEGTTAIISIEVAKNGLNSQVLEELDKTLDLIDISKIKSLIITGTGENSFVGDISEMSKLTKKQAINLSKKGNDIFRKIETFPIPTIAAINGFALGSGCEISMSCDIRISSENAIFGQPEVGLGITPGFGGTQRLPRLIGSGMAKQIIFTGQNINAEEALRIGLINAIYPKNDLLNEAKKMAQEIAKNGDYAIKNSKKALNEGLQIDIDKGIQIEEKYFGDCFETPEQKNRMENFLKKNNSKKTKGMNKELQKTDIFSDMTYLQAFTTPTMPAVLSVGDKNNYNSMLISWGSLGVAYKKPIFTVYVKPDTYTHEFMEKYDIFTVSFIKNKGSSEFLLYGTLSGRNYNKEKMSGSHIKFLDDGGITFEEANEVYVCRKLLTSHFKEEEVDKSIIELYKSNLEVYQSTNPHSIYIGEIIGHYKY